MRRVRRGGRIAAVARPLCAGLALAALASGSAAAQRPTLAARPSVPPPMPFRFPAVVSRTLPSGLRLVVSENHSLPVVAVRAVVDVDSTDDPAGLYGLADVTGRAIGQAATAFTDRQLADTVAALGVSLTETSVTARTATLRPSLDIMAELLMHPVFSEDAVTAAKASVAQARHAVEGSTAGRAREILYDQLFGAGAAYNHRPTSATIAAITQSDVRAFHAKWYTPTRTTVIMVGDITPAQAERDLADAFGSWARQGAASRDTAPARANRVTPRQIAQTTIYLVDRPGAKQSSVIMGTVGPERAATDFPAASAFDAQFGGTISSRLPRVLRQQHAWAYTVFSHIDARSLNEPVVMWASADVSRENTDSAVVASLAELGAAQAQGASTAADLQSARNIIIGSVQRIVSTDDRLADRLADLVQSRLPLNYYTALSAALDQLTPADVTRAGAAFESPEHVVVVVVGDRASIEAPLRATGLPVVIVAPTGR